MKVVKLHHWRIARKDKKFLRLVGIRETGLVRSTRLVDCHGELYELRDEYSFRPGMFILTESDTHVYELGEPAPDWPLRGF